MASNQSAEPRIEIGSVKRDTETGRVGVVQRSPEGPIRLHALRGEDHWEVDPLRLVDLTAKERLGTRVALANYWSRAMPR
ncbi:hypothetical protein OH733_05625 [Streptomyces griseus]|uniref:hypothetical protein n=1 Tax=Streptomyces griseus TaxID=1911 RepID=UPI00386D507F|nr:hypothetical protein OH733_05625 [Streptomyces griseus]WTD71130.1 hypothetical protein OH763_31360 [Streptomyces griseus]